MGDVLAVVEQQEGRLRGEEVVSQAARIAAELGGEAHALVIGGSGVIEGAGALGDFGARRVRVAADEALVSYHPDGYPEVAANAIRDGGYAAVFFAATAQGKDLAPRLAARLDLPLAQDVTGISVADGRIRIERPVYAGKALAHISVEASPVIASLRPNIFPLTTGSEPAEVEVLELSLDPENWPVRVVSFEARERDVPDVSEARIVVSGGRGMKDPENWEILEALRAALGSEAGLGSSRAVVDAGWRPHSEQVGQTGKTVAPRLYFAIGISGAVQHQAGMRTAGVIVAVNRDPEAPIFKLADYGIVGDLFEVVPRMTEEVRRLRGTE